MKKVLLGGTVHEIEMEGIATSCQHQPGQLCPSLSSLYPSSQLHSLEPSVFVQMCPQFPLATIHSLVSIIMCHGDYQHVPWTPKCTHCTLTQLPCICGVTVISKFKFIPLATRTGETSFIVCTQVITASIARFTFINI